MTQSGAVRCLGFKAASDVIRIRRNDMSKPARQTNFDRVLTVLEEMIPVWRDNSHKTSPAFADFLEKNLEGIKPGKINNNNINKH